jgi:diguanylate cyclase (GGDEF)-like protein
MLSRKNVRVLCWLALLSLVAVDAMISSPVSLGLIYFAPLAYGALRFGRREGLALAAVATLGRIFFGPVDSPLGLGDIGYALPEQAAGILGMVLAAAAYLSVALVVGQLNRQRRRIRFLDRELERDPLTGAGNRRALTRMLTLHEQKEISLLVLDLDHFKAVNDTHGHEIGDRVLQEFASRAAAALRRGDLLARVGGEEFVAVLPGADAAAASAVADRILEATRRRAFTDRELRVTVSIGIASGPQTEPLLARADLALYSAKNGGRDRFALAA